MNGAPLAPPQVIRHNDGTYSLLNVDLDALDFVQRIGLGVQIWDQVRTLMEKNGLYQERDTSIVARASGIGSAKDIDRVVAELVGIGRSSLTSVRPRLLKRPDVVERMAAGEFASAKDVMREIGMVVPLSFFEGGKSSAKKTSSHYGYGDKFDLALGPMRQYFRTWRKKGFAYRHVNPKEAQRRVKQIDQVMADLAAAREDLVQRSHVASYALTSERKENK